MRRWTYRHITCLKKRRNTTTTRGNVVTTAKAPANDTGASIEQERPTEARFLHSVEALNGLWQLVAMMNDTEAQPPSSAPNLDMPAPETNEPAGRRWTGAALTNGDQIAPRSACDPEREETVRQLLEALASVNTSPGQIIIWCSQGDDRLDPALADRQS